MERQALLLECENVHRVPFLVIRSRKCHGGTYPTAEETRIHEPVAVQMNKPERMTLVCCFDVFDIRSMHEAVGGKVTGLGNVFSRINPITFLNESQATGVLGQDTASRLTPSFINARKVSPTSKNWDIAGNFEHVFCVHV